MKISVFGFLGLFFWLHCFGLFAQTSELNRIDSLSKKLERQDGAERINTLIALSMAYRDVSYDKALQSGMDALQYAEAHKLSRMKAHILRSIGQISQQSGDYDLALRYFRQSLQLFQLADDQNFVAKLNNQIGDLKSQISEYDSALFYFEKVISLSEKLKNDSILAYAVNNSGNVWFETGELGKAHDAFYKASIMFAAFGDSANHALAEMNLSQVLWQWDENEKAISLLEKTIRFARRHQQADMLARACSNLGLIYYYDLEDYPRALEYFEEALKIRELKGQPVPTAHTLVNIANVGIAQGEIDKGIEALKKAIRIYQGSGVVQGEVRALYHLAEAYQTKKDFALSNAYFLQCLSKAEKNNIAGYGSIIRSKMMDNFMQLKDFPSFLRLFEEYKVEADSVAGLYGQLQASEASLKNQYNDLLRLNEKLKNENAAHLSKLRVYSYLAASLLGIAVLSLLFFMLWKRSKSAIAPIFPRLEN